MWAMISWPFSSFTRNMVFGSVSETVPSNSMTSSFAMWFLLQGPVPGPESPPFCHAGRWRRKIPGKPSVGEGRSGHAAEGLRPRSRRGWKRGLARDLGKETPARPWFRTQRAQVPVLDLGIEQRPAERPQVPRQRRQREFRAPGAGAEHALGEEHPAYGYAV